MTDTRVMIVDDEEIVCDRLKNHLEKEGYEVEAFISSKEAIQRLESSSFHVVVTDLKMAGPTGLDVLQAVRDKKLAAEVILITGYASLESAREAEAIGVYESLCKPFELKDLTKLVRKASKKVHRGPSNGRTPGGDKSHQAGRDSGRQG